MKTNKLVVTTLLAGLMLAGCASSGSDTAAGGGRTGGTGTAGDGSTTGRPAGSGDAAVGALANVVYFDFDASEVRGDQVRTVDGHAKKLAANASLRVRLEGHADERGTREYNIALGERRANAVQQALTLRGVSPRQISVVSYGEERPVSMGHDEPAWGQNRRVEFVYQ